MAVYDYSRLQNGSDIRGVALEGVENEHVNLDEEAAERLARGFLYWLTLTAEKNPEELTISVGRDPRLSGEAIADAFCRALKPYGCRILNAGLASTPAMFMSTIFEEYRCDGAVMITASHLPANRNGMKFFDRNGGLNKGDITDIITFAESDSILNSVRPGTPKEPENIPLLDTYAAHLRKLITDGILAEELSGKDTSSDEEISDKDASAESASCKGDFSADAATSDNCCTSFLENKNQKNFDPKKPLADMKITVDAGNGSGGFYADKVLKPLGADVSSGQFLNPDGTFPAHAPNPEDKKAMASICKRVKECGSDLGLIFDTDVDRSAAVDENGNEISRNGIVAMAAALIADEHPGTTVVTDSITSRQLTVFLEGKLKLRHLRFKRGYKNVINKSIELCEAGIDSQLAIETSGHAAYKENYFLDDGAYLATKIVISAARLFRCGKGISSLIEDLKEPAESVEIRFPILAEDFSSYADRILSDLTELAENSALNGAELVQPNYEGVRINFNAESCKGWALLRKSLHDPIMPLNIESDIPGGTDEIRKILKPVLSAYDKLDSSRL